MIPPNQGSSVSQDSSLNKTPWDNCYISGYEGPNDIFQDVTDREQPIISVIKFSNPEGETVTRGSPYKSAILNSPEFSHHGKTIISPDW